jgi:hypothetical protein
MIIAWMVYTALLTTLVCVSALAAERVVAIWRGARRFVWLAALGAATVVPVLLSIGALPLTERTAPTRVGAGSTSGTLVTALSSDFSTIATNSVSRLFGNAIGIQVYPAMATADPYARSAWMLLSGALLVLYLGAMVRVRLQQRHWRESPLDGEPVLLAHDVGPAVVGAFTPRVVMPDWAFSLDRRSRMLVLRHEEEHIRAGDPQLLLIATFSLVLFPWNPALWFIVSRFRLATEVDCDSRVLLESDEGGEYGMLLLAVCGRRAAPLRLGPSFVERTAHIERRIMAMTAERPRRPLLASVAFGGFAAIAIAFSAPHPAALRNAAPHGDLLTLPSVVVSSYRTGEQSHVVMLNDTQPVPDHRERAAPVTLDAGHARIAIDDLRSLLAKHNPEIFAADSWGKYYVSVVLDSAGKYVWSAAAKNHLYFFGLGKSPSGDPLLLIEDKDKTSLGVFDTYRDVNVAGIRLAPNVAGLELIMVK